MHNYFLFSTVKCNSVMKIVYLFATIETSSCFLLIFRLIKEFPAARISAFGKIVDMNECVS